MNFYNLPVSWVTLKFFWLQKSEYFIKKETLLLEIIKKDNIEKEYDLNGHTTYIELERK